MGDGSGGLATGEKMGREVVELAGLEAEGFGEEADLGGLS